MGKIFSLALNERIMFRKSIYGDKQQNKNYSALSRKFSFIICFYSIKVIISVL